MQCGHKMFAEKGIQNVVNDCFSGASVAQGADFHNIAKNSRNITTLVLSVVNQELFLYQFIITFPPKVTKTGTRFPWHIYKFVVKI